jgi:hypothetical protein
MRFSIVRLTEGRSSFLKKKSKRLLQILSPTLEAPARISEAQKDKSLLVFSSEKNMLTFSGKAGFGQECLALVSSRAFILLQFNNGLSIGGLLADNRLYGRPGIR